jgi:hypothetical protein
MISNLVFSSYTYPFLFHEPLKNENKDLLDFIFFNGFATQFSNAILRALYSANFLSKEGSKYSEPALQGERKAFFFTSNAIILQSMRSIFLRFFPHIILVVQSKILWLNLKKL